MGVRSVRSGSIEMNNDLEFCSQCLIVAPIDLNDEAVLDDWGEGEFGLLCPDCLKLVDEASSGPNSSIASVLLKSLNPDLTPDQIKDIEDVLDDKKK